MQRVDPQTAALRASPAALALLLRLISAIAAALLAADLCVVLLSVFYRYVLAAPIEWSDDVARGLMVALSFFGAAGALARDENIGVGFFVQKMGPRLRRRVDAMAALVVCATTVSIAWYAIALGRFTTGQTTGSGLPLELTFYPMGAGAVCMSVFALARFLQRPAQDIAIALLVAAMAVGAAYAWSVLAPSGTSRSGLPMAVAFVGCIAGGVPIGFALAFTALVFIWLEGALPGMIFAQQMARGIDNFVLLAIPFFILVGYLMEANGMSVRLIALLERLVGRLRGGLNVVMVLSMVIFSGISGSKMADVAAVGSVLIPAARRSRQNPGAAVALLAASAVMAETIPPCINLIILGFVANLSIGGLFMAGLLPAGLMALVLIAVAIAFGGGARLSEPAGAVETPLGELWGGAAVTLGLLGIIFGGFRAGVATATEISAFGAFYALVVGGLAFRELGLHAAMRGFANAATRAGLVLFIVAAAQSLSFVLTLQQIPQELARFMIALSHDSAGWLFQPLSILILIVMGSVLEGAAALIIFGPLLVPVAADIGISGLHYGVVLVIAMGIGLFAPPLGLGLYGACLIGEVPIEATVRPMLAYLGLLLACLLAIAFTPSLTLWLPRLLGYQ
ncbi:MAG TPA: TRAP transporter large permease subunit [Roseiarcus sp.]|jgi:tripartite ATP-independent transporter DctM subunit|nr:TRAP transporter large permease subunit [Roseiarcus sp.]